jgi:thiamine phosphate synthase YjbQ (UPF0047 family)
VAVIANDRPNPMHITASVFVNDDESGLHHDYDH